MKNNDKIDKWKLLQEFAHLYKNPTLDIHPETEAIIILAGNRPPVTWENSSRVKYARALLKKIDKKIPVIFSGINGDEKKILSLMVKCGIPKKSCLFQDCGNPNITNTKIQFERIASDKSTKDFKRITVITSTYHIPRARRTASKILPKKMRFTIAGDPDDWKDYNALTKALEEMEKINEYSVKGDIV